jgi:fatty-acyl-CoA synthase
MAEGVARGDNIAIWLPNRIEWVLGWFAAAYVGAAAIPINTRYRGHEFEYVLGNSNAVGLFMIDNFLRNDYLTTLREVQPLARPADFPNLRFVVRLGVEGGDRGDQGVSWEEFARGSGRTPESMLDERVRECRESDTTIIIYTSGSTGYPKGVMHSHRVLRNECSIAEWLQIDSSSKTLGHMPFFHAAGGLCAVLPALITGSQIVLMSEWNPTRALELIERHGITTFGGIATHYVDLLNHPALDQFDVSSLRCGWMGGALTPPDVIEGAIERLGIKLFPVYGMTETTGATTYPRAEDPIEVTLSGAGVVISDFEVKLVDVESYSDSPVGEPGEVCVRGHAVMQGYYGPPELTAAVIDADGWFHTGDIGVFNESGFLKIVGRLKEMLIVGGNNLFPAEVERILHLQPAVAQAHVVAVPDERLGEIPVAYVECVAGQEVDSEELMDWCASRLASYKRPRHIWVVTEWPKTGSGKVDRRELQLQASSTLGLGHLLGRRLLPQFSSAADGS